MMVSSTNKPLPQLPNDGRLLIALSRTMRIMGLSPAARQLQQDAPSPGQRYPLANLFPQENLDQAQAALASVLAQGRPEQNLKGCLRNKAGERIACEYSAYPIIEGGSEVIGVILSINCPNPKPADAGAPAASRAARRSACADAGSLFEALPQGVFTVDCQCRITSFNQTAEQLTGFHREQALGRYCWQVFRSDRCHQGCPLRTALKTGQTSLDQPVSILRRNGRTQTLMVNVSILKDSQGRILGGVETLRPSAEPPTPGRLLAQAKALTGMVGQSAAMQSLFAMMPDIAASEANVLISGESGTGKELVAKALHHLSHRGHGPFMAVNCSALAENLLESELFGHEKGAFTGAERQKPGRFERSAGGTLFLDEIGELKPALQVKLLRVLEQKRFERVGGSRSIPLNARIISATNQDLNQLLHSGRFRKDLYYRLRTVPVKIPPLRERPEDIPPLVEHFIRQFNDKYAKKVRSSDPKVMRQFLKYGWPGNVRELERCIEHAFVFVKGPIIFGRYLPEMEPFGASGAPGQAPATDSKDELLEAILTALAQTGGKRAQAARLLGISRTSLWRRMKALGLA